MDCKALAHTNDGHLIADAPKLLLEFDELLESDHDK